MERVLAIDVGGTKLAAATVTEAGAILRRATLPTPSCGDPEALWSALVRLVERLPGTDGVVAVGVGCGGPMRAGGDAVSPLNIPAWRDFPLRSRLVALTGLPTFVDNDAKALALGEGWLGAAVGQRDYIAVVVSTGVGGGIVLDGRMLNGADGNAGHVGHVIVVSNGRRCGCGARGCVEAEASGTAIAAVTGGPPAAAPTPLVTRTGTLVGRALASVANLLDLRLAVVAGSVALGYGAPFFAAAQQELDARCRIAFARGAQVRPAALPGHDSPLVGAARVALLRR